ncbi:MAG: hypothetical protein IBX56_06030, partial [Methylomicrobium sp.]|nr:hypothetical protein [Methylomicrobium sp.]
MNQTSENSREYQAIRSEIAHIAETIQLKRGDIADLEKLISEKQLLREEAADQLLNAKKLLAYLKMTTEQYMTLASSNETLAREIEKL